MLFFVLLALCIHFVLGVPPGDTDVPSLGGSNDCEENCKPGPKGEPGIPGPVGISGLPGPMGVVGSKGDQGVPGFSGLPGLKGEPGQQGVAGLSGPKGEPGFPGVPGIEGDQGPEGLPGFPGLSGIKGEQGNSGHPGLRGFDGMNGAKGERGSPGINGLDGRDGLPGLPGLRGPPGPKGDQGTPSKTTPDHQAGHLLVKHSQNSSVPVCGQGDTMLWSGYSLIGLTINGVAHAQDLGHAGSCVLDTDILPVVRCKSKSVCHFGDNNDRSTWLVDDYILTAGTRYPSRCVVCDVAARVLTVHSRTSSIPECPNGWSGLWSGYSFITHDGGSLSLSSSGSCLEKFRESLLITSVDAGLHYYDPEDKYGTWMATRETAVQFKQSKKQIQNGDDVSSRISRCQVCMKNK